MRLKPVFGTFLLLAGTLPGTVRLAWCAGNADQAADYDALREKFVHPPDDTKIMVRWWWFGPSVTDDELEREMRLMKERGIGGFEVQPVYPLALDDPSHGFQNYPYLSDRFLDALRFTSATAHQLGLRMDLTLGSGWPYGGPSVTASRASGQLRLAIATVRPDTERYSLPYLEAGQELLAIFLARGEPGHFDAGSAREVSQIGTGAVQVPSGLEGPHVLVFFIASRTGQMVKRSALGAEGFVLDHYDRAGVENYLHSVGDRLMQAFPANPPFAIFCDSLEVYGSDWTGNFMQEFRKRRGYDLKPYLPGLAGDIGPKTAAIRHDWGQTLTELFNDNFISPLEDWARRHHTLFRAQLYGVPPAVLSSYALIDLPEGEKARWRSFAPTRWASSASHLYGRTVTSSETWTWLHSPAFRATPLDFKAEADVHFLEGINQFVGHGWPYSPPQAGEPGWRFYAAAVLNHHNPWWIVMPDLALYCQRVSFMLRQGRPVNDIALYIPTDDAWAHFTRGQTSVSEAMDYRLGPALISRLLDAGYNFDLIDDAAINNVAGIDHGALVLNGSRYEIVLLPGVERMPLVTLQKLDRFARQGGALIATHRIPSLAPGFMDSDAETPQIRELSARLFEGSSAPGLVVRDLDRDLAATLHNLRAPDVSLSPASPDIGFVHRRTSAAEIYFVANTGNQRQQTEASFRADADLTPAVWDPFTGEVQRVSPVTRQAKGIAIALDLEPYGSRILVFSRRPRSGAEFKPSPTSAENPPQPLDLSTGWKVTFLQSQSSGSPTSDVPVPGLAAQAGRSIVMEDLRSWTDDGETRFFSGSAVYEKTISLPAALVDSHADLWLDFGEGTPVPRAPTESEGMRTWFEGPVREAAVVYVNGKRAGSVWHPPYEVKVTGLVQTGENQLRVVVANTAINEMAGAALPDYRLLNDKYGERFTPQDMQDLQPLPSGLLGHIRLVIR